MSTSMKREPLFENEGDLSVPKKTRSLVYITTLLIIGLLIIFIALILPMTEQGGSYSWIQYYGLLIFGIFISIVIIITVFYKKE